MPERIYPKLTTRGFQLVTQAGLDTRISQDRADIKTRAVSRNPIDRRDIFESVITDLLDGSRDSFYSSFISPIWPELDNVYRVVSAYLTTSIASEIGL